MCELKGRGLVHRHFFCESDALFRISHPILVSTLNFNFRVYLVKKKSVFRKVISNLIAFTMVTDSSEILSKIVALFVT